MKKRLLALVLALVMVVAILPVSVLAAPGDEPGQANLTPGPVTSDDNLVTVEKSAAAVDGQPNTYDVTLTVTTKDTVSTTPAQSTDVVLVIDASNSMDRSKLSNAKSAAREFSSIVLGAGAAGENRIAVVSYGKTSEAQCGLSDSYWTVQNAINGIYANGGTNIQAGLKAARDILDDSTADNKVILVLSDGEPTYSFRVQGTAQWTGCYEGRHGRHYWTGDIKKGTVQFTGFDYSHVVGSGSAYSLYNGARLTVTCEHGKTDTVNYTYYKNNGDPTIAEAGYAKEAGCEIYSIYLGGKNDTNAIDTMKGIASGDDHFQTTDDVDELADLFKGIAGEITTPTNAGIVTDPMGDFVELDSSVSSLPGVSVDSEGFTWDVSQTQPTSNPDGSKTYTMTYRVTLDTSALGFTTGVYPLNKTTTFTYQVGSDGQDRTVAFKVPTVYGEAAQYNVTYSWTGAPASGVTLPTDSNSYYAGDVVAVDTTYVNGTTVEIGAFRYTFHGWDTTGLVDGKMPAHDVTINGEWTVTSIGVPGLSVDKTVVSVGGVAVTNQNRLPSAVVGQLIRYQIVVKNTGNVKLTNVKVSDKLWEKGTEITVNGDKYTLTGSQFSIGSLAPKAEIVITYSYRATLKDSVYGYVKNGVTVTSDNGPTTSDEVTIKVYPIVIPDVPEDNTPNWLNTKDHYAYIVGYNDGTVKPNNNITRAEVATIFFRLLTDDARAYYWSTDSGFSDVKPGDWYNNAVSTMVNAGILNGYSDGTFKPNANITRAEFATIAARFLSNSYSLNDRFYDTEGHWAEPYINRAAEVGWINGYNDGSFKPNKAITRAEAVTLVNAVLGREPHEDHLLSRMVTWPDNPKSAWYYEDIQEATNSHDYVWASGNAYEIWTKLLENRNWAKLEKEWSTAYSAPGGDVMG